MDVTKAGQVDMVIDGMRGKSVVTCDTDVVVSPRTGDVHGALHHCMDVHWYQTHKHAGQTWWGGSRFAATSLITTRSVRRKRMVVSENFEGGGQRG